MADWGRLSHDHEARSLELCHEAFGDDLRHRLSRLTSRQAAAACAGVSLSSMIQEGTGV
jgi:hypothetical protein